MGESTSTTETSDAVDEARLEALPARRVIETERPGSRYLVIYGHGQPRTRRIADAAALEIRSCGHVAELADLTCRGMPHPADYDALVVMLHVGWHLDPAVLRWLLQVRRDLESMPMALFVVGRTALLGPALDHLRRIGLHTAVVGRFPHRAPRRWFARVAHHPLDRTDASGLTAQFVELVDGKGCRRE